MRSMSSLKSMIISREGKKRRSRRGVDVEKTLNNLVFWNANSHMNWRSNFYCLINV